MHTMHIATSPAHCVQQGFKRDAANKCGWRQHMRGSSKRSATARVWAAASVRQQQACGSTWQQQAWAEASVVQQRVEASSAALHHMQCDACGNKCGESERVACMHPNSSPEFTPACIRIVHRVCISSKREGTASVLKWMSNNRRADQCNVCHISKRCASECGDGSKPEAAGWHGRRERNKAASV